MMVQQEVKTRVYWKLVTVLLAAIAVLVTLLGSIGAVSDCNEAGTGLFEQFRLWHPNCRAGMDSVPTSLLFLPPLIALLVVAVWRKLKRGTG